MVFFLKGSGDPIEKYVFRRDVVRYLNATYPQADFHVEAIEYGIQEGDYWAAVRPEGNAGIRFEVRRKAGGGLADDYLGATWERETKQACEAALFKLFPGSDCFPEIVFTEQAEAGGPLLHALPFPPYRYDPSVIASGSRFGIYVGPGPEERSVEDSGDALLALVGALARYRLDLDITLGRTDVTIRQRDFAKILSDRKLIY
ncbi:hypothetical protein [Paenibacillus sp. UNC496MF]|uniref:YfjL-like protein n=1 Tax=Paenibacillus sp. UNC496MF TaxID=1502753 RepID=UPI000B8170F2|nr:hypothetical protein [Paenibacillus sp. UNC496MF]